jgi:hypothetical protein
MNGVYCLKILKVAFLLLLYTSLTDWFLRPWWKVFTVRYGLSPYIKQITFRLLKVNLAWILSLSLSLFPSVSQFSAILVKSWTPFQLVTTSTLKTSVLWSMIPWIFVYRGKVLGKACCRHNQSRISWISLKMGKASSNEASVPYINLFSSYLSTKKKSSSAPLC